MDSTLASLARLIGEDKTRLLLYKRGGEQVYIPARESLGPEHWLVQAVGEDAAGALADALRGTSVVLPLGMAGLRNQSWAMLDEAIESGLSTNQIVRKTGLSTRTASRRRNSEAKPAERMGTLYRYFGPQIDLSKDSR
jgi:hypothetical protein